MKHERGARNVGDMRGSGRTSQQMLKARPGALFIWCGNDLSYPMALAQKLDRTDLSIEKASVLNFDAERLRGSKYTEIVVDHAYEGVVSRWVLDELTE